MELMRNNLADDRRLLARDTAILIVATLALMLPFIDQALHIDAHLTVDWARQALNHPLWHHMADYNYFGINYEIFFDTKPRLFSLYVALLIDLANGVSPVFMHLAMLPFPIIAILSMYSISRRFRVNAPATALLLLLSPAFLANAHLIMTDVPGLSLWMAGLAAFIYGADRDRLFLLLLSALPFTAAIFIYYQGAAVLPLAFAYLVTHGRLNRRTVICLSIPVAAFLAFLSAYIANYASLPNVTYPVFGLPLDPWSVAVRVRGVVTLVGSVVVFPLVGIWLFPRSKKSKYAMVTTCIVTAVWVIVRYLQGLMSIDTVILLPLFMASGTAIIWSFTSLFTRNFVSGIRGRGDGDSLWLAIWFLGILFYCAILLPYPSPRYLLPIIPPTVIMLVGIIESRFRDRKESIPKVLALIAAATFILSISIAIAENQRANTNVIAAEWAAMNYENTQDTVWFNGGLGFQYYMEQKGYRMLLTNSEEPQPGDVIIESVHNGRWGLGEELSDRVELIQTHDFRRTWPVSTQDISFHNAWIGIIGVNLPYSVTGAYVDRIYVYKVIKSAEDLGHERREKIIDWFSSGFHWTPREEDIASG